MFYFYLGQGLIDCDGFVQTGGDVRRTSELKTRSYWV